MFHMFRRGNDSHGSCKIKIMLTVMAGIAEFERSLMLSRCNEGREVAKTKGVQFGRPRKGGSQLSHAIQLYKDKSLSIRAICEATGVSKATLCRRIAEAKYRKLQSKQRDIKIGSWEQLFAPGLLLFV